MVSYPSSSTRSTVPRGTWRRRSRRITGRSSWHTSWLSSLPTAGAAPTLVYGTRTPNLFAKLKEEEEPCPPRPSQPSSKG